MKQLIQAEWYKIQRSRTLAYLCLAILSLKIISILSASALGKNIGFGQDGVLEIGDAMTSIWIGAFTGFFIASEFQNGSIRNVLSLGKNRKHVFLAKFIAVTIALVIMLFVMAITQTIMQTVVKEFGSMTIGTFISFFFFNFFNMVIYHLPYAGFFTLFAFLSRKPGLTILLALGYEFTMLSIGAMLQNYPDKNLKPFLSWFPPYYYTKIEDFLGNWAFITNGYVVSIVFTIVPILIGIYKFKNTDIK
jgi:ABC-2 type transport system permease protein